MTIEKIKNIAVIVATSVLSICTVIITYAVIDLKKSTKDTLTKVNEKVDNLANDYKLDQDSWLAWAIKNNKPKTPPTTQK